MTWEEQAEMDAARKRIAELEAHLNDLPGKLFVVNDRKTIPANDQGQERLHLVLEHSEPFVAWLRRRSALLFDPQA